VLNYPMPGQEEEECEREIHIYDNDLAAVGWMFNRS